jgi:hypothetical protein
MGNNTEALLNFIPRMDPEALLAGYRKVLASIYSPAEYFERAQAMIARLGARPKNRLVFSDYVALSRSLIRQGVISRYRVAYWRFLGKTFFRAPRHLGLAVTLAIMGHHFFILSRRMQSKP